MRGTITALLCVGMFFFVPASQAQVTTGTISGTVADSSGAVLPGSTVLILHEETGVSRTVQADVAGRYAAPSLALGSYRVTATLEGFQSEARSGIVLTVGRQAVVNFVLPVGAVTQTVEVTGEAPLVETTQSSVDFLINETTVRELPLNGRDITQLVLLNPGINLVDNARSGSMNYSYGKSVAFSGFRPSDNAMLLDGTEINSYNNLPPSGPSGGLFGAETIQEFVVKSGGFSAAYGRAMGGVVNAVTKSGTNAFHGTAFEFLRNSALDARNFFDKRSDPPPFKRNQFGGTVGGPIVRDKTFFFVAYEGLRQRRADSQTGFVPDANLRQGIFSTVPRGQVAPIALRYFALYPLPSPNGRLISEGVAEYFYEADQQAQDDVGTGRIDHHLSDSDSLFGRLTYSNALQKQGGFLDTAVNGQMLARLVTLSATHIFSPRALNTFRFGFSRTVPKDSSSPDDYGFSKWPSDLISNRDEKATPRVSPGGGLTGLTGGTTAPELLILTNRFEYIDDFNLSLGSHALQFGGNFQRVQNNLHYPEFSVIDWGFGGIPNFLRALPTSFRGTPERFGHFHRGFRQNFLGLYVQDDWRATPKLTLNLGLRYDLWTAPAEQHGELASLRNLTDPTATPGEAFRSGGKLDFSPRFGFAWSPVADGKTSVRGGFGLFYHRVDVNLYWIPALRGSPISPSFRITNPKNFPDALAAIQAAFPIAVTEETVDYAKENGVQTPYSIGWNLNAQRQLGNSMVISVGYVGNRGVDLSYQAEADSPKPQWVDGFLTIPQGATKPNPSWNSITLSGTGMNSWYNALQVSVQKRMSAGLQFQLAYTFSKVLSEGDSGGRGTDIYQSGGGGTLRNLYYRSFGKGLASFDVRNSFTLNYVYEMPFGPGKPLLSEGLVSQILGGWDVNGIVTLKNGEPFSISGGGSPSALRVLNVTLVPNAVSGLTREDITWGSPNVSKDPTGKERYFNPAGFAVPGPRQIGNVGRNTMISPGAATWDVSLSKNFRFTEQMRLQFRAEAFNLFNRANFANPSGGIFDNSGGLVGTAGIITGTTTHPREIQFGLKLVF